VTSDGSRDPKLGFLTRNADLLQLKLITAYAHQWTRRDAPRLESMHEHSNAPKHKENHETSKRGPQPKLDPLQSNPGGAPHFRIWREFAKVREVPQILPVIAKPCDRIPSFTQPELGAVPKYIRRNGRDCEQDEERKGNVPHDCFRKCASAGRPHSSP
jgi:hypothetical protein